MHGVTMKFINHDLSMKNQTIPKSIRIRKLSSKCTSIEPEVPGLIRPKDFGRQDHAVT